MNCGSRADELKRLIAKIQALSPIDVLEAYEKVTVNQRRLSADEKEGLKKIVIEKFLTINAGFEKWNIAHGWFYYKQNVEEFRKPIADKLAETAKTFDDWHGVYSKHVFCADYTQLAIERMEKLATDERQFSILGRALQNYTGDKDIDATKIICVPSSFDEWLETYRQSKIPGRQKEILEMIFKIDVSFEVLYVTHKRVRKDRTLCNYLVKKMSLVDASLEDWCGAYAEALEGSELKLVALQKIKEAVK